MQNMTIGQVAKQTGVGIETIRFYERKGLLNEPKRKDSGYRLYDDQVIERLTFIKQAKVLGFSLIEINELLSLEESQGTTKNDIRNLAEHKLKDIDEKIKMLKKMQKTLKRLVTECDGKGSISGCPILNAIKKT